MNTGAIHPAASGSRGPWRLALDHAGVIEELGLPSADMPGPGLARCVFDTLGALYAILSRIYRLAASLPDAPLRDFRAKIKDLPKATEAERLTVRRIGQDIFRAGLMDYWQGRCPLTGIADPALLRASHIIPWKDCTTDAERLDVHDGLLLSALWDAAFDRGLVTFDDVGRPAFSPILSELARAELRWRTSIRLTDPTPRPPRMAPRRSVREKHGGGFARKPGLTEKTGSRRKSGFQSLTEKGLSGISGL